ncbi:MAG: CPBP family intramembrane metalloprotease, partial [Actinomycetota bacterium]|nr:CPBP family intramembrane metalloprotease [Actinomycetota bacterium]
MDQHNFSDGGQRPIAPVSSGAAPLESPRDPAVRAPESPGDAGPAPGSARNFVTRSLNLIDTQLTGRLRVAIEEKADQLAPGPVVLTYVAVIAIAEILGAWGAVVPGAIYHAALIPILLSHYVLAEQSRYRRILPVLALFPLLRILSWTMPIKQVPYIFWYALVGIPLLVGVAFTIRLLGLSGREVGLSVPSWPRQVFIALLGLPLSALAFLLVHPSPVAVGSGWQDFAVGVGILLIATGFTEELLFRGLLQPVAVAILGRVGMLCTIALFTIMYLGAVSWGYTLFMGLVGWLFGGCVQRTRSIAGVTIAHGLLNIGLLLVWPRLAFAPAFEPVLLGLSLGLLALWLLVALPLKVLVSRAPAQAAGAGRTVPGPGIAAASQELALAASLVDPPPAARRRPILAGTLGAAAILLLFLAAFRGSGIELPPLSSLGSAFPAHPPTSTGAAPTAAST